MTWLGNESKHSDSLGTPQALVFAGSYHATRQCSGCRSYFSSRSIVAAGTNEVRTTVSAYPTLYTKPTWCHTVIQQLRYADLPKAITILAAELSPSLFAARLFGVFVTPPPLSGVSQGIRMSPYALYLRKQFALWYLDTLVATKP